jgi:flagellar hook-associated protein 1 FlgK
MSISSLLFVARDSLLASQMGIDITGGNIANVNTPGYSRQRAIIRSTGGNDIDSGVIQTGVNIEKIERQYDSYLEGQLILQKQNTGYSSTLNDRLTSIESIFDESSTGGLTDQLNEFWSSWETLSTNPAGQVERDSVVANAQSLAGKLSDMTDDLTNLKSDIQTTMRDMVSTINTSIHEIRTLNEKIAVTGSQTGETNVLQDKLTNLVGELGAKIGVNWYGNTDGTISVFLENGTPLVERLVARELEAVTSAGNISIYSVKEGREDSLNGIITRGQLGALVKCQDEAIPEYQGRIDAFAKALADSVNAQHQMGYDSDQNVGGVFFTYLNGSPAGSLEVNADIVADLRKLAASATVNGDGDNATRVANIQHSLLLEGNSVTLNAYQAATVGNIGREVADSKADLNHQTAIMENVSSRRESISGVSIDEEMILLMKYQMSYRAAGKLANTVTEMLDVLMSLGGRS